MALARAGLGRCPVERNHFVIEGAAGRRRQARQWTWRISLLAFGNGFEDALAEILRLSPSRSSSASCSPVEAPEGTAARPSAPPSRMTSAFDGGVAARIDDLAGADASDLSWHVCVVS